MIQPLYQGGKSDSYAVPLLPVDTYEQQSLFSVLSFYTQAAHHNSVRPDSAFININVKVLPLCSNLNGITLFISQSLSAKNIWLLPNQDQILNSILVENASVFHTMTKLPEPANALVCMFSATVGRGQQEKLLSGGLETPQLFALENIHHRLDKEHIKKGRGIKGKE